MASLSPPPNPTRASVLTLAAQPAASWAVLEQGLPLLDRGDRDPELMAVVSAHAVRLGFRTIALDALDALDASFSDDPQVVALREAARSLRSDRVDPARRVSTARANLDRLAAFGESLRTSFDGWARGVADGDCFLTGSGVAIRASNERPFACSLAPRAVNWNPRAPRASKDDPTGEPPILLAGFSSPWLLQRTLASTPPGSTGYSPRVWLVESDARRALDALSLAPLPETAAPPRVRAFLGEGAEERLRESLRAHDEEHLPREVAAEPNAACVSMASDALRDAAESQVREHLRLHGAMRTRVHDRDAAFWAARFAANAGDEPIRVLIATTRYSTVMHASAVDLADGLGAAGCRAEVLAEPDAHAKLSSIAYLRRIERFDPDLIVLINYPRSMLASAMPEGIPLVTWVQDTMPHFFDPALRARATPLDLAVGGLSVRIVEALGLRPWAHTRFPIVASTRKFHEGPTDDDAGFTCEVAYVGNQSETADALCERVKRTLAAGSIDPAFVDRVRGAIEPLLGQPDTVWAVAMRDATSEAIHSVTGRPPSPFDIERLIAICTQPLADRLLRHQTLEWAAEICARRGWRMNIHGHGWEKHPTLARFARGPAAHGEPLRAIYRTSAATLHASVTALAHQRVLECALSGGVTLCRHIEDAINVSRSAAIVSAFRHRAGEHPERVACDETPDLQAFTAVMERMGRPGQRIYPVDGAIPANYGVEEIIEYERSPLALLVRPESVLFTSESALEDLLERAVTDRDWRAAVSEGIAAHTRAHASHEALARAMLDLAGGAMRELTSSS